MTGSRYNKEVAKAWREVKKPYRFTVDVNVYDQPGHENPDYRYFVELVVYSDEIQEFSEMQRLRIMEYLVLCQSVIESYGIKCFLGGVEGPPPILPGKG
jgi:hypothetical protein